MTREWYTYPGVRPEFCPFCGDELQYGREGGSVELQNTDHHLWEWARKHLGHWPVDLTRYVCYR